MAKRTYAARNAGASLAGTIETSGATAAPRPADSLFATGDANLAAALRAGEAMVKGVAAIQQEIAEYANAELKQGFSASESLRDCRDPAALFNLQCDLARQATQRFFEEAGKLMSLAARIGGECWQPFEERTKETLDRLSTR